MKKVRWGILSTAEIGLRKVIPGILKSERSEVVALASRDGERAQRALESLGLGQARAYGDYEALLNDSDVDVVYNPLPNHLHMPLTLRAARAGKHVLCEKPIAMTAAEAEELLQIPAGTVVAEAFMIRHHEQWKRAREIARSGELGRVHMVRAVFSYFLSNPHDIRNSAAIGGGGMLDIGCYCILAGRYFFGAEPLRVVSQIDRDPTWGIDRLASVIADFGGGRQLSFVCGTQMSNRQSVEVFGTAKSLEIIIPFNAPPGEPTAILVGSGAQRDLYHRSIIPASDQYTSQADAMAAAILDGTPLEFGPLDALQQMRVIDAILESEQSGSWEQVSRE